MAHPVESLLRHSEELLYLLFCWMCYSLLLGQIKKKEKRFDVKSKMLTLISWRSGASLSIPTRAPLPACYQPKHSCHFWGVRAIQNVSDHEDHCHLCKDIYFRFCPHRQGILLFPLWILHTSQMFLIIAVNLYMAVLFSFQHCFIHILNYESKLVLKHKHIKFKWLISHSWGISNFYLFVQ